LHFVRKLKAARAFAVTFDQLIPMKSLNVGSAVLTVLAGCALPLFAQDNSAVKRPKIGLVLGGGGARGLAHVGVLEWLEEHRIPVDYIAGTSMGGLVGGLYAMGMTPAQLRALLQKIDWNEALRGDPSYAESLLRRKQDRRDYPGIQLGWNNGFRLRAGLNGGHFVSLILDRAALPYWQIRSFDELPLPFRCVAADLVTAKAVVLGDGAIAEALRATMAIPGLFTPVERGNAVLVDGGVLNNVPTDVAKAMGADVIIAVSVGTPLRARQDLASLIGVLDQTSSLAVAESVRKNLLLADIVLTPDLGKYSSASFSAAEALTRAGYAEAAKHESELRRLEIGRTEWEQYAEAFKSRVRRDAPVPKSVVVQAPTDDAANAIRERLQKYPGRPLSVDAIEKDLTRMLGWGRYSSLNYDLRLAKDPSLSPELVVRAESLVDAAAVVRIGLGIQGAHNQQVELNLRARTTVFDIGGYGSELRMDASLGTTLLYGIEYYRPIGKSRFFVAPRGLAYRATTDVSPSKDELANYRRATAAAGIDLGYGVLSQTDEVRFGYETRYDKASVIIGSPDLPVYSGTSNVLSLRWFHDGQDSATVPRRGVQSTLRGSWFLNSATSSRDFPQAELTASAFHPIDLKGSVFATLASGTTFNRTAPLGLEFALGGPLRLSSYGFYELRGSDYALAGVGYLREIRAGTLMTLYAIGAVQAGRVFRSQSPDRTGLDITAGMVADTFIGPIFFGAAVGDAGHRKLYVSIGRTF
jgi:NTE family protein